MEPEDLVAARHAWLRGRDVAAALVYVNALDNPFVYDDFRLIVENPSLLDIPNLRAIAWREVTRPIVNFCYALDRRFWGPTPFGFHVTNVLLHTLNVGLVFLLAWRWNEDWNYRRPADPSRSVRPSAASAAALCRRAPDDDRGRRLHQRPLRGAVHDVLCSGAARDPPLVPGDGGRFLVATLAMWVLALASKETAAMLPFVVLAYDRIVCPGSDEDRARALAPVSPADFAAARRSSPFASSCWRMVEHHGQISFNWPFLLVQIDVVRRYLTMLLMPGGQSIFHAIPLPTGVTDARGAYRDGDDCAARDLATGLRRAKGSSASAFSGSCWRSCRRPRSWSWIAASRWPSTASIWRASVCSSPAVQASAGGGAIARATDVRARMLRVAIVVGVLTLVRLDARCGTRCGAIR